MFAIIKTGGKQYKVAENDIIKVEKLNSALGEALEFTDVLMMGQGDSVKVGTPRVAHAKVLGTVLDQIRDDKVIVFKKKRRHNYRRKNGHRQYLTVVRITEILGEEKAPKVKAASPKEGEKSPIKQALPAKAEKKTSQAKASPTKAGEGSKKPVKKKAAQSKNSSEE